MENWRCFDEKPRPMGIKGRGQSGSRRFRIAPWAKASTLYPQRWGRSFLCADGAARERPPLKIGCVSAEQVGGPRRFEAVFLARRIAR